MSRVGRQFLALLAAIAVFVVGTTCTRAGCVIPVQPVQAAAQRHCCADPAGQNSPFRSNPGSPKSCPACEHPLFAGDGATTTTKTADHGHFPLAAPALFLAPFSIPTLVQAGPGAGLPLYDGPPPNDLATRLALSCALLN
jgi:hypothetical protein